MEQQAVSHGSHSRRSDETAAFKVSDGGCLWSSTIVVIYYASAFSFLALTVSAIPVRGLCREVWVGILFIVLIEWVTVNGTGWPAKVDLFLIVAGVTILSGFSKTILLRRFSRSFLLREPLL
ncbi:MAG: hypothetical protein NNA18_03430 [Nitrospira sp.]|nr:hypothetical protein [Nitrospira sp.]